MAESLNQILKDSQSKKHQYLKYVVPLGVFIVSATAYAWYQSGDEAEAVYTPQIYEVAKGDISSTVNSNGNIINPDIVNLSFLINGTLESLEVEEGEKVVAGQVLAQLDTRDLNFDLQSAQNDVNIAWQNIKARQADITDTDIINATNDLIVTQSQIVSNTNSAQQNLEIAQKNAQTRTQSAEQTLEQTYTDAQKTIENAFPVFDKALIEIDYVFGITRNYPNQTIAYQAFNDSVREGMVRSQHRELIQNLSNLQTDYRSERDTLSTTKVTQYLNKTQSLSRQFNEIFELITIVFSTSNDSSKVPQTLINSSQATLQSLETQILNANSNLSNALQSIDRAELDLRNTKIDINNDLSASELNLNNTLANLNNDLKSAELKISNAEKTVNKSNISKQTSLNIQYAQYEQSKLRVEKALYNVSLATLVAPRDGTIIRLNGSVGESLKADSIDPENAFIRIVSDANFTTEVYVEEIDIAQINIGQKALISLDALPDVEIQGQVSFISGIAEIDNNGIVTYLVRIDITDAKDQPIREGMTTFVDFITGEALDAIVIPNSALIRDRMVMLENGETVQVETGFTDGDLIEIKSGLSAGDKIVSNPQVEGGQSAGTGGAARGTAGGNLSEERLEQMKAAGFTDDELTKLQAGEISDAMRTKMQSMRENAGGTGNALGGGAPTRGGGGGGRQ